MEEYHSAGRRPSRRDLLWTLTAGAAAAALPIAAVKAQTKRGRIDVHHHMLPPFQDGGVSQLDAAGFPRCDGQVQRRRRNLFHHHGPAAGWPTCYTRHAEGERALARQYNEYGAKVVSDYPKRFGFMGTLPLMDVDATLNEIEYVFDTLKADGSACFPIPARSGWAILCSSRFSRS